MNGGSVSFHWLWNVAAVDRTKFVTVGDGNAAGTTGSANDVADYVQNVSDWYGDGTEAFGICLRTTTATPVWTTNATCDQSADAAHWRGVPTANAPASKAAIGTSQVANATAKFRFGLRIAPDEPPGELSAGITFVVVAPDV
jgi:hypothetical protein